MYRTFKTEKNLAPTSREDDQNLNTYYKNLTPVVIIRFMNFVVYYYLLRNDIYTSTGTGSSNLNQSNDRSLSLSHSTSPVRFYQSKFISLLSVHFKLRNWRITQGQHNCQLPLLFLHGANISYFWSCRPVMAVYSCKNTKEATVISFSTKVTSNWTLRDVCKEEKKQGKGQNIWLCHTFPLITTSSACG